MKIVFFGNNVRGTACLKALLESGWPVAAVVTHEPSTALWGHTVADVAWEHDLELHRPEDPNAPDFIEVIAKHQPTLGILAGYGKLIRKVLREVPAEGFINLHGGAVPEYRGSSITRWVLINGETQAGISILRVDAGIDTGDVLAERRFDIDESWDARRLIEKQLDLFPPLLLETLEAMQRGGIDAKPQDPRAGCCWHALKADDGRLDFARQSARQVCDMVRAFAPPYEGAWCPVEGKKLRALAASPAPSCHRGLPGRVCTTIGESAVVIARDRGVCFDRVAWEDGVEMPAKNALHIGMQLG